MSEPNALAALVRYCYRHEERDPLLFWVRLACQDILRRAYERKVRDRD